MFIIPIECDPAFYVMTFNGLWRSRYNEVSLCIFRNKLLNVRTTVYDIFVIACLFVQSRASSSTQVARFWHKGNQRKSKLTRSDAPTFTLFYSCSAPISNIEVKNMKSADCLGFTHLQRILLQHLGYT